MTFHLSLSKFRQGDSKNPGDSWGNHPRQWTTTVHFPAWLDLVRWSTSDLVDYTYTIYPQSMYFYHLLPLSALSMGKFRWSQQLSPRLVSHSIGVGFFAKASQTFMTEGDIPVPWTMGFFQSEHGRHFWRLFHIYVDVLLVFPMMSHFFPITWLVFTYIYIYMYIYIYTLYIYLYPQIVDLLEGTQPKTRAACSSWTF